MKPVLKTAIALSVFMGTSLTLAFSAFGFAFSDAKVEIGGTLSMGAPDGTTFFRIDANTADSVGGATPHMGTSVAAGNITGHTDRTQDIIIGVPGANVVVSAANHPAAGKVYVVYGTTSGSPPWAGGTVALSTAANRNGTNGFEIDNDDSYGVNTGIPGQAGHSVAAGNITNDTTNNSADDVIIGAPNAELSSTTNSGKVYVVFGRSSTWAGGPSPVSLAALNGSAGTAGKNGTFGFPVIGTASSLTGQSVAAGDINGDGIADLIIGAPAANPARTNAGSTYVIFGQPTGSTWTTPQTLSNTYPSMVTSPISGFRLDGSTNETSGTAVAAGCSPTGNGIPALLIGAPAAGSGSSHCVSVPASNPAFPNPTTSNSYVVFGSSSGYNNGFVTVENLCNLDANNGTTAYTNGYYAQGQASGDLLGTSMAALDINMTGKCAVAIGAPGANSGNGYVYIVLGQSKFGQSFDLSTLR